MSFLEFRYKDFNYNNVVNDEEMLDFALYYIVKYGEDAPKANIATKIVMIYILKQFKKNNVDSFTEEDIIEEYKNMYTDKLLSNMVEEGLLETYFEDGKIKYKNSKLASQILGKQDK